jgi:3',5'-cyclic-AMP phosphodiesterase
MGHTHYNELSNDGRTVYAATRSTGQIEEGPVGFSIMHVEGNIVSWHFKPLHSAWPVVMLTSPADGRLETDVYQSVAGQRPVAVSARAWSANGIRACRCRWDEGPWYPMRSGRDSIEVGSVVRAPAADGSDADALGLWPEKHILGTQLGPNRNGRQW